MTKPLAFDYVNVLSTIGREVADISPHVSHMECPRVPACLQGRNDQKAIINEN